MSGEPVRDDECVDFNPPVGLRELLEGAQPAKYLDARDVEFHALELLDAVNAGHCPNCQGRMIEEEPHLRPDGTPDRRFFQCQNTQCKLTLIDDLGYRGFWWIHWA